MTSTFSEILSERPIIAVLMVVAFLVIFLILGVLTGNVIAMKILTRMGIPVLSGKIQRDYRVLKSINKDVIGWLQVPNTCYNPITTNKDGFYKNHSVKGVENKRGELFLADGHNSTDLSHIANPSTNGFKDLAIIMGTATSRKESMRENKFTFLKKYVNSDLKRNAPDIYLVDNGNLRIFNLLFAVEIGLENKKDIKFNDRVSFLSTMRSQAYMDTGKSADNDVVILSGSTGLDTMLVFLVEKVG